jgi:amino acid permease
MIFSLILPLIKEINTIVFSVYPFHMNINPLIKELDKEFSRRNYKYIMNDSKIHKLVH